MKKTLILIFGLTFLLLGCQNQSATTPAEDSDRGSDDINNESIEISPEVDSNEEITSYIASEQIEKAKRYKRPIISPSYVPVGFKLASFKVRNGKAMDYYSTSHHTFYKGPNGCSFSLNSGFLGFGEPYLVRQWTVKSKLLGQLIIEEFIGAWDQPDESVPATLATFVTDQTDTIIDSLLPSEEFPNISYYFYFYCKNSIFPPEEAIKILESMEIK